MTPAEGSDDSFSPAGKGPRRRLAGEPRFGQARPHLSGEQHDDGAQVARWHRAIQSAREQALRWLERVRAAAQVRFGGWGTLRAVCVAIVPIALAPWLWAEVRKELASPLFRDAAQCQYSGWCVLHGVKLYRDVGAPDGPLVHFLHAFLQIFVGNSDQGFRRADLALQLTGSGVMGGALAPRSAETRAGRILSRIAWALLGMALWLTWYLELGWGQTIQRDGYFALLGYAGLVLIYASADYSPGAARIASAAGGALCMLEVFGRHSGMAYVGSAVLGLWLVDDPARELRALRWKAACWGALGAVIVIFLGLLFFGSIPGLWFWYFRFPFTFHRWLAKQNAFYLLTEHYVAAGEIAVVILVGVVVAVALRMVPRRALSFAFPAMLLLFAACIEGKGWSNHVQQTTAATVPLQLLVLSELWGRRPQAERWGPGRTVLALGVLLLVAYKTNDTIHDSGYLHMAMPQQVDSDIVSAKILGDYLKAHTKRSDRILMYGHESHVLLNAERAPAVPYYVNMSLNVDVFYKGAPAAPGEGPNAKQLAAIKQLQAEISADACHRLTTAPPAAMVFLDNSFGIFHDGRAEVITICPPVEQMLKTAYTEVSVPGAREYYVYLKRG